MARIIIATDLSDASRPAFEAGLALAQDLARGILLVHALDEASRMVGIAGGAVQRDIHAQRVLTAESHASDLSLAWAEEARRAGIDVDVRIQAADSARLILDVAKEESAPMIVVGTHGRTGLKRLAMGSVAEEVLRHADRPVLVVPCRT